MSVRTNVVVVGATRQGKTLSAAKAAAADTDESLVVVDPHQHSLAEAYLTHASGNILHANLSDLEHTLGFDFLVPSSHPDPHVRAMENRMKAEAFVAVLLRRRDADSMAGAPLMEEHVMSAVMLMLYQGGRKKRLSWIQYVFQPGTKRFDELVRDCMVPEIREKFLSLKGLSPRALRAEVGSAVRLIGAVAANPAFELWSRGGFDLGAFLQRGGKLVMERGNLIGDDTMRVIMGAVILLTIAHATSRPVPRPPIRVLIDEATNARLVGSPELRGVAETSKYALYWTFLAQNLDFPGGADAVLTNCLRHEFFGCPHHAVARLAATDILAGLPRTGDDERSRAERLEWLTTQLMTAKPGWRWVREQIRSWNEYVPMLGHPWPDWPGLREAKHREKLAAIHARPEYGVLPTPNDSDSSGGEPVSPTNFDDDSGPASRWTPRGKRSSGGSAKGGGGERSVPQG